VHGSADAREAAVADRHARLVPLALAGAIASISFAAIFFRLASPTSPLVSAGTRLALASAVLAYPTLRALRAGRLPPRVLRRALLGGLFYALHFGTWVTSLTLTSVASSVTLVTATPLLLAGLALLSGRDRPEPRHWASIALALVGLGLIGWADLSFSREALFGDALAFAGAVAMALYLFAVPGREPARSSELAPPPLDVLAYNGVTTLVGALALLGAAVVLGVPIEFASDEALLWVALSALVPQLVGHTLLTWSLRHATPTAVGISTVGEPVGATLLAWLWLGERVGPLVALGCSITLSAVLLTVLGGKKTQKETG
jgi:drug/metabolite transporter (DMT)-like permease